MSLLNKVDFPTFGRPTIARENVISVLQTLQHDLCHKTYINGKRVGRPFATQNIKRYLLSLGY